jgi:hypothetical protein
MSDSEGLDMDDTYDQENGMAERYGRRLAGLAGVLLATIALLVPASPASAQVPPGAPLVGSGIVANCPPGSPGAQAGGTATINGVTVYGPAGAQCTPLAATTSGEYSIAGVTGPNALRFNAACANTGGTVTTNGFVDVPPGTLVNGVPVATTTTITTLNTPVVYPDGRTAIVNQVITTPTTVTRNAIVFAGGPTVGQVICGASAYPLAVSVGGPSDVSLPALTDLTAGSGSESSVATLVAGGAVALAIAAQVAFTIRRRRNTA